jgi:hypothetical protein
MLDWLAEAHRRRGLTQAELGKAVGAPQRVIACTRARAGSPRGRYSLTSRGRSK